MLIVLRTQGLDEPRYCEDYLNGILRDLAVFKLLCLVGDTDCISLHTDALKDLLAECHWICEHQTLFPDDATRKEFLSEAYHCSKEILSAAAALKDGDNVFSRLFEDNAKKRPRSTLFRGEKWSDYLQSNAAGSGLEIEATSEDAYIQVVTEPGLKLLNVWRKEGMLMREQAEKVSFSRPVA